MSSPTTPTDGVPLPRTHLSAVPDHRAPPSQATPESEDAEIRAKVANLEAALVSRSHIDRAVGMTMQCRNCDSAAALSLMKTTSQDSNIKVRDIAYAMAESAGDHGPEPATRAALAIARRLLTAPTQNGEEPDPGT